MARPYHRNPPMTREFLEKGQRGELTPAEKRQWTRARKAEGAALAKAAGHRVQTPAQKRALKREHAFRRYRAKGLNVQKAARKAMSEVPYGKREAKGKTFKGVRAQPRRKARVPKQYRTVTGKRTVKRKVTVPVKRKVRVAYGRYKRVKLDSPRTGKKRLSYQYRRSPGHLGHIPAWRIAGAKSAKQFKEAPEFEKARARIAKRRRAAAKRVSRSGDAFVPNRKRRSRSMKVKSRRKSTKRSRAAKKGWARRRARTANRRRMTPNKKRRARHGAQLVHRRPVGKGRGRRGVKLARGKIYYKGRRPRGLKRRKGVRKLPQSRIYLTNRRRRARRLAENRRYEENRRRRRPRKRHYEENRRRRRSHGRKRKYAENRRRRHGHGRKRKYAENRRRRHGRHRGTKHRRYGRNAFLADMKRLGVAALFGVTGFFGHKVITRLLVDKVITPALGGAATGTDFKSTLIKLAPVWAGLAVAGVGIFATGKIAPKYVTEVGLGMLMSLFHTGVLTALGLSPSAGAQKAAQLLAGYDRSGTAAAIGYARYGMRGLGDAPVRSLMPRYAPIGRRGVLQQAVAGRPMLGTGEYFQTSGLGEYFASGVQGIGAYELAGPLVTQAAAGLGQQIDDGIRPDANLDAVLTLAEAQAGVGEYYSANPGGSEFVVPQDDQWIPNNPLWAGTKSADDSQAKADLPAGILETSGGNGIFG